MHKQGGANNSKPFHPFPQRKRWFKFEVQTRNVPTLARVVNAQSKSHNVNHIDSVGLNHAKASSSKKKNDGNIYAVQRYGHAVSLQVSPTHRLPITATGHQSEWNVRKHRPFFYRTLAWLDSRKKNKPVVSPSSGNRIKCRYVYYAAYGNFFFLSLQRGLFVFFIRKPSPFGSCCCAFGHEGFFICVI